jgi:hypothetical protein
MAIIKKEARHTSLGGSTLALLIYSTNCCTFKSIQKWIWNENKEMKKKFYMDIAGAVISPFALCTFYSQVVDFDKWKNK